MNGRKHTLELGNGVCDGLNKIVLFYANKNCLIFIVVKIVLFLYIKIDTAVKHKNSRQNGREGLVLVQGEWNEISAGSEYGSTLR